MLLLNDAVVGVRLLVVVAVAVLYNDVDLFEQPTAKEVNEGFCVASLVER